MQLLNYKQKVKKHSLILNHFSTFSKLLPAIEHLRHAPLDVTCKFARLLMKTKI
jgi:hypothetical protein